MLIGIGKCISKNIIIHYFNYLIIIMADVMPCYRLMLLPIIEFGRCYNQIDNGMLLISILMADVIAMCG